MSIVKPLANKIKPVSGFSHFVHIGLMVLLPVILFVLIRVRFFELALVIILLSKWRMFAVRPRHWLANIRANAVDIMVGVSIVVFMANSGSQQWQFIWAALYALWLILIKPGSSTFKVSLQAAIGQLAALSALFLAWGDAPSYFLVIMVWLICYGAARHFLFGFDESLMTFLSYAWAYFAAALVWVLSHWLLFYGVISQPTLLLSVLAYGLAALYYLEKTDRLSTLIRRQFIFVMVAIVVIVIAFSDWGDKAV
jgi:hypothetical protein